MESRKLKESYLRRRTKQLRQWERVINRLISRADKANSDSKSQLRRHIIKIQVKKARTEVMLRQLNEAGYEKWDELKAGLEKSWKELRTAFLKASARTK